MKVSAAARHNLRSALRTADLSINLNDSDAESLIRHVRQSLGKASGQGGLQRQAELMVSSLQPLRDYVLEHSADDELDSSGWSAVLWDLLTECVNGTIYAAACPDLCQSEAAWEDMIVLLNSQPSRCEKICVYPAWGRRRRVSAACWILALLIGFGPTLTDRAGITLGLRDNSGPTPGTFYNGQARLIAACLGFLPACRRHVHC